MKTEKRELEEEEEKQKLVRRKKENLLDIKGRERQMSRWTRRSPFKCSLSNRRRITKRGVDATDWNRIIVSEPAEQRQENK